METTEDKTVEKGLDLSELKSLSFGPAWSTTDSKDTNISKVSSTKSIPQKKEKRHVGEARKRPINHIYFKPTVEVSFHPEEESFKKLTKALRISSKTYQLFEIVQLLINKYEHFFIAIRPQKIKDKDNGFLYISVPDHLPFESEDEAIENVMNNHIDKFFDTEAVKIDPPKGSFQAIARCTQSGALIGPPNYHRYPELIRTHLNKSLLNKKIAEKSIELVKDKELIDKWLEQMSYQTRYIAKNALIKEENNEPTVLDSLEKVRHHLLTHCKKEVIMSSKSVKLPGTKISELPKKSNIYQSIQFALKEQKKFPLETANHLRSRLRKLNFNIYKNGSKGISYVCNKKPITKTEDQVFTESVEKLINFIKENPDIKYFEVPNIYLKLPTQTPEQTNNDNTFDTSKDNKETLSEKESPVLDNEQKTILNEVHRDLRWLVEEGYVTRYSDDSLFIKQI